MRNAFARDGNCSPRHSEAMTIYIVTSTGFYDDDRSIDAAFSSGELAEAYIVKTWKDRRHLYNVRVDVLTVDQS